ncbi:MAG: hypothetical protein SPF56_03800 [Bacteroidaceae bacterium]|nr:hypothetical protein [Prevotellaceae bacterium]MDY5631609.1 hypothetical protein [Bacteroidaceae bacterium]
MTFRILILSLLCGLSVHMKAQKTPFQKYEIPMPAMVDIMLDYVERYACQRISNGPDEFFGQTDPKGTIYGFGRFVRQDGTQIFGLFRNGQLVHGITLTNRSASVGNPQFYSSYNLGTGVLEYVFQSGQRQLFDTHMLPDYRFLTMSYSNGDQYVGEVYKGLRHGLGIYYYANGSIWFGQYNNNVRSGFGCLFSTEDDMTIGLWEGDDQRRDIYVRMPN